MEIPRIGGMICIVVSQDQGHPRRLKKQLFNQPGVNADAPKAAD